MSAPAWSAARSALKRPRNRVWLGVAALALLLRVGLPYALRPILVEQADAALSGRIALADLDLSLIRGGVTLRGLEIYANELEAGAPPTLPPVFDAQRLWVQVSWLALLAKTLRVEELELEGFRVRLERTQAGLALPGPAESEVPPEPELEAAPQTASSWSLAADAVRLRDGAIGFVDRTSGSTPQRFDLALQDLSAEHLELAIGPAGAEPGRVQLAARVGQGSIGLDARVEMRPAGPAVTSKISLTGLPLRGVQTYLKMFGWGDLQARLDAELVHRFETGGAHEVSGGLSLVDVVVRVPDLERPALAWQRLDVELEAIDLVGQRAALSQVVLTGARIPLEPRSRIPVPLLAPVADAAARSEETAPGDVSSPAEPAKPWTWHVGKVQLARCAVELLGSGEALPLDVDLELRDLDSARESRWPLSLALRSGGGKLDVAGALGVEPLAFEGTLAIADLALPPLLARSPAPGIGLVRSATARADLRIALTPRVVAVGEPVPTDLRVSGTLGLSNLDVGEAASAREFAATWKDLEIGIRELAVPDLLAAGGPRRIALGLEKVLLADPALIVTRAPAGLVLPSLDGVTAVEPPLAPTAPPTPAAPGPEIVVDVARARIQRARARILDRSVDPTFRSQVDRLDVDGRGLRWPGPEADSLSVTLRGLDGAKLDLSGSIKPGGSTLSAKLSELRLAQFNPYVASSGFSVNAGALAFDSEARFAGAGYETSTGLVVSQLDLGGAQGAERFQETFGIPVSMALGLLKDLQGNITLSVPVAGEGSETRVDLASIVGQALRQALVGALSSPLKLLGAVVGSDGKVEALAPGPVPFPDGGAEIGPEGAARIAQLAQLLTASPALSLTLSGGASESDLRSLRERALLAELGLGSGLGDLGEIRTRRAVRAHLEARYAGGPPAELDEAQRSWLAGRVEQQQIDPAALDALASARADAVRRVLSEERGIAAERLALGATRVDPLTEQPSVAVALGVPEVATPQP